MYREDSKEASTLVCSRKREGREGGAGISGLKTLHSFAFGIRGDMRRGSGL